MPRATLVNLTPHPVHVLRGEHLFEIPSAGEVRLSLSSEKVDDFGGVPILRTIYQPAEGLPHERENAWLIVSALVRIANPERKDLLSPARVKRDEKGNVVACEAFDSNL